MMWLEPSPTWRKLGYMTMNQACQAYWLYRALCVLEKKLGRKLF